jgi:signal transduction histidine kinase
VIRRIPQGSARIHVQASLRRAEKLEAIGVLAGSVAHDLNNILSGILSYPELILLERPCDSPLRTPLLTIQKCGQRAAAVVQDLLTLVRNGNINLEVTNLNDTISNFLTSPEFKKIEQEYPGTHIQIQLQPDLLRIQGSPVHLTKAIMNLILNAMEAMDTGGRLLILTQNIVFTEPSGHYESIDAGEYVAVTITDNGNGIPTNTLDRIFEPFYTKKVMGRSGTGLGLPIVWGTVKDHGGFVDVSSQEGKGTVFTLYFPATTQEVLNKVSNIIMSDYIGHGESIQGVRMIGT